MWTVSIIGLLIAPYILIRIWIEERMERDMDIDEMKNEIESDLEELLEEAAEEVCDANEDDVKAQLWRAFLAKMRQKMLEKTEQPHVG